MSFEFLYFLDDAFLITSLPVILTLPLIINTSNDGSEIFVKKSFFISLRFAQFCLFVTALLTLFNIVRLNGEAIEQFFFHSGSFFFRKDILIQIISLFTTFGGIYYLYLIGFVFARTSSEMKYIVEIPFLVLMTIASLRLFLTTTDLLLLILLIEIAAFASVILIGLQSTSKATVIFPIEAAIKYFIINAVAISFLLFALVFYFFLTNSLNLIEIGFFFQQHPVFLVFSAELLAFTQFLFFFAFFIKLGAAPVHHWVPDVYEGAETLITIFLVLIISPPLVFKTFLLIKQLNPFLGILLLFKCIGLVSVLLGTINAFYQTKIKRFIAYAGVTHFGFMLLAVSTNDLLGYFSAFFYLFIYYLTNIGFFTLFLFAQNLLMQNGYKFIYFTQLKALFSKSKFFFFNFLVFFLSFAGIPPFAGFFVKFFVLVALLNHSFIELVIILIFAILVGTYLYLRFIKIALFEGESRPSRLISSAPNKFFALSLKTDKIDQQQPLSVWENTILTMVFICSVTLLSFILFLPVFGSVLLKSTFLVVTLY